MHGEEAPCAATYVVMMIHVGDGSAHDLPLCRRLHSLYDLPSPYTMSSTELSVNCYSSSGVQGLCLLYVVTGKTSVVGEHGASVCNLTCSLTLVRNLDRKQLFKAVQEYNGTVTTYNFKNWSTKT